MPKMTPGNKLYLYQLLKNEIGTGRQTLLSRVEEVLVADDLAPQDLGYDSTRELVESLGDMVKLTVFKKGNTYATLLPNAEWDQLLAKPAGSNAQQKATAKGKPWKHRAKTKALKPTKPRHVRTKEPQVQPTTQPPADEVRGGATSQPAAAAREAVALASQLESKAASLDEQSQAPAGTQAEVEPTSPAQPLPLEGVVEADRPKVPPTHHIKLTVTYDPYAGIERDIAATEKNLSEAVLESTRRQAQPSGRSTDAPSNRPAAQAVGTVPGTDGAGPTGAKASEAGTPVRDEAKARAAAQRVAAAAQRPQAATSEANPHSNATSDSTSAPQTTTRSTAAPAPEPTPAPQTAPASPNAAEPQTPSEPERQFELLDEAEEAAVAPEPILVGLPRDLEAEVYVPNGPLSLLYQLLPPGENPNQVLASDWQVARSTRSYGGTRNLVTFPLHITRGDGSPVGVTMRRTTRPASGRHWAVTAVDGNDGSEPLPEDSGPYGLPETDTAVERLLARSIELGPWNEALAALAAVARPEAWDLPGRKGDFDVLRLYLAMTWRAVLEQGLLAVTADNSFAAFDTGLLSPLSEHVYACLEGRGEESPWGLLGFSTTGEGELGSQLAQIDPLPHAPRHLSGFSDLAIAPGDKVDLSRGVARTLGDSANELVTASVRQCAADWRIVAPAVDVDSGDRCLLLPLGTDAEPARPTRALCVDSAGGSLRATAVHDLARAYVEARVVSRSTPAWLQRGASPDVAGVTTAS